MIFVRLALFNLLTKEPKDLMKRDLLIRMPIVKQKIFLYFINRFYHFSRRGLQLMYSAYVIEVQRVLFFVNIIKNETNPIVAVCNNFTHHKVLVTLHDFIELRLSLSWQRVHNLRTTIYNKYSVIFFDKTKIVALLS